MKFIADLHIHSHFSIATSSELVPEQLELWAQKKGITVAGTGDAIHPGWYAELKEKLKPEGNGLFSLKKKFRTAEQSITTPVQFMLTTEISCIYKRDDRVRKVHNVLAIPDFDTLKKIQSKLDKMGNIRSDGRPILGLDSRDLLEIVLEAGNGAFLFPAHIWTPWFSALGSKSGFDSIEDCYGDLANQIFAVETGLSSDPSMNWKCSKLDRFALVSNSDAHSPEKLGREANLFDTELSFHSIAEALRRPGDKAFLGTIEYFPQEGKYHLDGHRKCGVCWEPHETDKHKAICPVCGKQVTVGVLSRLETLSDRKHPVPPCKRSFYSITPLVNVIAELLNVNSTSKKVRAYYESLLKQFGPEFTILLETPLQDLKKIDSRFAEGIDKLRRGQIEVESGYDGVFGKIRVLTR